MTPTERVESCLRTLSERGEVLCVGHIYNIARDLLSAQLGSVHGQSYGVRVHAPDIMRAELRDGERPGETMLYIVDDSRALLAHFGVPTVRDFEAKETLEVVLSEFARQRIKAAA